MCGIYGTTTHFTKEVVKKKLKRISFRGPDYTSIIENNNVILGHNRLSIIDLNPRSHQPFKYNEIFIVFNGEVYNFHELRNTLIQKGYKFYTESDTEVVCASYLEYGKECVNYFNGMFSFVIQDTRNNILFGAVDRTGQKPLFYTKINGSFEFSSQLSPLEINNEFTLSQNGINQYLIRGYIPSPNTIYNEVEKIPAGFRFYYNLSTKEFIKEKYWDIDVVETNSFEGSYEEAVKYLDSLLQDAVHKRMISDVPIGIFLSGGIDSTLITSLALSNSNKKVKTFTIKFDNDNFDESPYAESIAKHLGTDHKTILCDINEGLKLIENHNYFYDEPFADSSAIPSMLLAKHTKEHVTVALSGDAGDENFIGYTRYDWINKLSKLYNLPYSFRKYGTKGLLISNNYRHKIIAKKIKENKSIEGMIDALLLTSYSDILISKSNNIDNYKDYFNLSNNIVQKASDYDTKMYLTNDILVKVDRAAMAFSLESRAPLLDYRVIEFARKLPVSFKYQKGNKKRILKDILYKYVPKELLDRPKSGFTMPFKEWFRSELKDYVYDNLTINNLKKIDNLNLDFVQKSINSHMKGTMNFYPEIWKLLVLIKWIDERK